MFNIGHKRGYALHKIYCGRASHTGLPGIYPHDPGDHVGLPLQPPLGARRASPAQTKYMAQGCGVGFSDSRSVVIESK